MTPSPIRALTKDVRTEDDFNMLAARMVKWNLVCGVGAVAMYIFNQIG